MELYIFGRFHARAGQEEEVAGALREVVAASVTEPGCLSIAAFRSALEPRLFFIHARWADEAAFDLHAGQPHTVRFVEQVQPLLDHPLAVDRMQQLA